MKTQTKETQTALTPEKALEILIEGNKRFVQNIKANRNLIEQVKETKDGQFPFATILSCIDSRVSSELIFERSQKLDRHAQAYEPSQWSRPPARLFREQAEYLSVLRATL